MMLLIRPILSIFGAFEMTAHVKHKSMCFENASIVLNFYLDYYVHSIQKQSQEHLFFQITLHNL